MAQHAKFAFKNIIMDFQLLTSRQIDSDQISPRIVPGYSKIAVINLKHIKTIYNNIFRNSIDEKNNLKNDRYVHDLLYSSPIPVWFFL